MEVVYQIYGQSNIENADLTAQTRDRLGSRHKHNNIYIYIYTVQTYILDTNDTYLIIINDLSSLSYRHSCTDRETHNFADLAVAPVASMGPLHQRTIRSHSHSRFPGCQVQQQIYREIAARSHCRVVLKVISHQQSLPEHLDAGQKSCWGTWCSIGLTAAPTLPTSQKWLKFQSVKCPPLVRPHHQKTTKTRSCMDLNTSH